MTVIFMAMNIFINNLHTFYTCSWCNHVKRRVNTVFETK